MNRMIKELEILGIKRSFLKEEEKEAITFRSGLLYNKAQQTKMCHILCQLV